MTKTSHDLWIERFKVQLVVLQREIGLDEACAIAEDCWVWDGWNSPEAAAQDYLDNVADRVCI